MSEEDKGDDTAIEHECEVCGIKVLLPPSQAYQLGWDYPPHMGEWGIISPRTCGGCPMDKTAWFALVVQNKPVTELTDRQLATVHRIVNERAKEKA